MAHDNIKKKLIYKTIHRGCKELDIILSEYINNKFDAISNDEIKIYEALLSEADNDIYNWIIEKEPSPVQYQNIIQEIIDLNQKKHEK